MTGVIFSALVLIGGVVLLVAQTMVSEITKQEYDSWAPALARALVRLAGRVHPMRADEWLADVLYLQTAPEPRTGLWEVFCHVCGAPKLAMRAIITAVAGVWSVGRAGAQRRITCGPCVSFCSQPRVSSSANFRG